MSNNNQLNLQYFEHVYNHSCTRILVLILFCSITSCTNTENSPTDLYESIEFTGTPASECHDLLTYPEQIWFVTGSKILVDDRGLSGYRLALIDIERCEILHKIRVGRGPGELTKVSQLQVSVGEQHVYIWDRSQSSLVKYNFDLEYIADLYGPGLDYPYFRVAVSENLNRIIALNIDSDRLITFIEFENQQVGDIINKISAVDHPVFSEYDFNNILIQDIKLMTGDEIDYLGLGYSSGVVSLNSQGIQNVTHDPINIPLPNVLTSDGLPSRPDLMEHNLFITEIENNNKFVFALSQDSNFHGSLFDFITMKMEAKLEEYRHSSSVHIYDSDSLNYLLTVKLPMDAISIALSDESLFFIQTVEGNPSIHQYLLTDFFPE